MLRFLSREEAGDKRSGSLSPDRSYRTALEVDAKVLAWLPSDREVKGRPKGMGGCQPLHRHDHLRNTSVDSRMNSIH